MDPSPVLNQTTTSWIAAIALGAAVFERVRNIKLGKDAVNNEAKVNVAKDELVKVITADRDTWKQRFDGLNAEFTAYREAAHKKDELAQAKLFSLNDEVAQLRAKTDMTPVMANLKEQAEAAAANRKEQSEINQEVLNGLKSLSDSIADMRERRRNDHRAQQQTHAHEN